MTLWVAAATGMGPRQAGISIAAAFLAGGFLSATGVLQQRAAGRRPSDESLSPKLISSLLHDRMWLMGLGTGIASYGFQALALAFGPLALVQPVFLSELIFAVPISVRLNGMRMSVRDWGGLLCVAGGLAIGIVSSWPRRGNPLPSLGAWGVAIAWIVALTALGVIAGRALRGPVRASFFAMAAAAVMALQSALLASTVELMKHGLVPLFSSWQSYAVVPVTGVGVLLVMSAYQAGPLAASMPVIDSFEPSIAVVMGLVLFGEHIHTAPMNLTGTVCGLVLFFVGIVLLDTSPLVHALQRKQAAHAEKV